MMHRIKTDSGRQLRTFGLALAFSALSAYAISHAPRVEEFGSDPEARPFWFSLATLAPLTAREAALPAQDPAAAPVAALFREKVAGLGDGDVQELTTLFLQLCRQYGFSPAFILGLIEVESAFRPSIESYAGAVGLMQVLPTTAEPIARELGLGWKGKATLADPKANLRIGFHYLSYLRRRFNGKSHKYVTAYNWGPARVGSFLQNRQALPLDYFRKVERTRQQYAFVDGHFGL